MAADGAGIKRRLSSPAEPSKTTVSERTSSASKNGSSLAVAVRSPADFQSVGETFKAEREARARPRCHHESPKHAAKCASSQPIHCDPLQLPTGTAAYDGLSLFGNEGISPDETRACLR